MVACPLVPTYHTFIRFVSLAPTFAPRFLQTPPRGDALALPLSFGSTHTWTGDFHPEHDRMHGAHADGQRPKCEQRER